jgi:hypothetical protein
VKRLLALAAVFLGATATAASAAPRPFMTGFADGIWDNPATANFWFSRADTAGAQLALVGIDWYSVSPHRPSKRSDPTDPANPAYNWGTTDQTVRNAVAHGLTVAFTIAGGGGGPPWADGPHRPRWAQPGTWKPNAKAFGRFMKAVARRYDGRFTPAGETTPLPHVRYYQPWSEPNLYNHLTPQWVHIRGHWVAESAIVYRGLLNAAYSAVKSVSRSDRIVTGGTAPFGDLPSGRNSRVPPAAFLREMLCLDDRLKPKRCPDPAHFDILAHHPYEIGGPWFRAINTDDVSLPDFGKLKRIVGVAQRSGRVLPRGRKEYWITEFSWDSSPPDPKAVRMSTWEHWVEESFYVAWHEGVSAMAWYLLADQPCSPNCADTYQSGAYYTNGKPKAGLEAFRFPFVVEKRGPGHRVLWGISPRTGTVTVQEAAGRSWKTVATFHVRAHGVFTRRLAGSGRVPMRARVGGETSITWG